MKTKSRAEAKTGTSGRVQSGHGQTELGIVWRGGEKGEGRVGTRCSSREGKGIKGVSNQNV